MTHAVSSPRLTPLKWPSDPTKIGLTQKDIEIVDKIVPYIHSTIGSNASVTVERGQRFIDAENEMENPRRLVVYKDRVFVVLNRKNGTRTIQKTNGLMKLVYNPCSEKTYIKKRIGSIGEETMVRWVQSQPSETSGFAEIGHIERRNGKLNYFEEEYPETLTDYVRGLSQGNSPKKFVLKSLIQLQDSLRHLHETIYYSSTLVSLDGTTVHFGPHFPCYHGDIAPSNCVVKENSQGEFEIRLIDYNASLNSSLVISWPSWQPPETCEDPVEYNHKYAIKKDAWQFGLLIGSILRGGPTYNRTTDDLLPSFDFILRKLKIENGKINSLGVRELTQKEINDEIDSIIQSEPSDGLKTIWGAIQKWLIVDPEKRFSIVDAHITIIDKKFKNILQSVLKKTYIRRTDVISRKQPM